MYDPINLTIGCAPIIKSMNDHDLCVKEIGKAGMIFNRTEDMTITDGAWYRGSIQQQIDAIDRFQLQQRLDRSLNVLRR